jgi:hypothetical protein
MFKKRLLLLSMLFVVGLFAFYSCGGDGGDHQPSLVGSNAYVISVRPEPTISVIDRGTLSIVNEVPLYTEPGQEAGHFLSVTGDGKYLWDAQNISPDDGTMTVYDTSTFAEVMSWPVGAGVHNTMTRDSKYLFASSTKNNMINVFDVANIEFLGSFDIGSAPHVGDISPDGKIYWITNAGLGHLLGYNIEGLPAMPIPLVFDMQITDNQFLHALIAHPNGKYVFVGGGGNTNVVDISTQTIVAQVPGAPHNYAISPDRKYLLSGELATTRLQFIDISTLDSPSPDFSMVKEAYALDTAPMGVSHESYDPVSGTLFMTLYRQTPPDGAGQLWFISIPDGDLGRLSIQKKLDLVAPNPHAIAFPGQRTD